LISGPRKIRYIDGARRIAEAMIPAWIARSRFLREKFEEKISGAVSK
jgi:hypothetical protein